jgi:hypothetical protein
VISRNTEIDEHSNIHPLLIKPNKELMKMTRRQCRPWSPVLVLVAATLPACGGGDGGDVPAAATAPADTAQLDTLPSGLTFKLSAPFDLVGRTAPSCIDRKDVPDWKTAIRGLPGRQAMTDRAILDSLAVHQDSLVADEFGEAPIPGNEAHDCQQLIKSDGTFGPLVTVWMLHSYQSETSFTDTVLVGGLYREGTDSFPELGITSNKSCLRLLGNPDNTKWKAWIVPIGDTENCRNATFNMPAAKELTIERIDQGNSTGRRFPISARWLDLETSYAIGLQCGPTFWCVLNPPAGGLRPEHARDARGDRQRLSYKDGTALKPSRLTGTIMPVPNLDDLLANNPFTNWTHVATITLKGNDSDARKAYAQKFRLVNVTEAPDTILIKLKKRGNDWLISYNDGVTEAVTDVITHTRPLVRGSMRWRWSTKDEGVWVQCPAGCCGDDWP